ncbi:MAG: type II secretion system protein [Bacillaceae bacterium]|nr:type II secretion system protein [Bacillaceae bacterium]
MDMIKSLKSERGISLIELLAALTIIGIVLVLLSSIFLSGLRIHKNITTQNLLQSEANYITSAISKTYYSNHNFELSFEDKNGDGENDIVLNDRIISNDMFLYSLSPTYATRSASPLTVTISIQEKSNPGNQVTVETMLRSITSSGE